MRVVVADDEPGIRRLVTVTLQAKGHEVFATDDGMRAWDLIQEHAPDVALLDIRMPGRNGLEITQEIREDPRLSETRVILISGMNEVLDEAAGYSAGADLYLTKPFSIAQLLIAVSTP